MKNLSIIIPHYNTPNLLQKLLNTIPQSEEIEVIVVDDQSDKSVEEYKALSSPKAYEHVIFLDNKTEKKGAGAARNIGLEKATGKWLLFADADDFFAAGFYEKVKKYFTTDNDVVFFKMTSIYLDTEEPAERHKACNGYVDEYQKLGNVESEVALRYLHITPCGKLISRQFIKDNNIGFDEVLVADDVMFSARVGHYMKNFTIGDNVIYCITRSSGTLTANLSEHVFDTRLKVFINYYHYLTDKLSDDDFKSLNILGLNKLTDVIKYRLGFKKLLWVLGEFRKNDVQILNLQLFNPIFAFKKGLAYMKRYYKEKSYLKRG